MYVISNIFTPPSIVIKTFQKAVVLGSDSVIVWAQKHLMSVQDLENQLYMWWKNALCMQRVAIPLNWG